uniref:NR LBD domain-containing protein n=1 Tax=Anisakis simplex TaxID=6269 RepID=A0A0M3JMK5_ANISI
LFTSAERLALLQWICLAMLERKRDILMNSDFSTALRLLQCLGICSFNRLSDKMFPYCEISND